MASKLNRSAFLVLDDAGKQAFQRWIDNGGVYTGVHAASACLLTTDFYRKEVGALFDYHPQLQNATFIPLDKSHPSMTMIPDQWNYEEEVYYFRSDPRAVGAQVLLTVDESSYSSELHGGSLRRWP